MFNYKAFLFLIFLAGIFAIVFFKMDRDGLFYLEVSKKVLPITQEWVVVPDKKLPSVFESDLTKEIIDWKWLKPNLIDYRFDKSGLTMIVKEESVWWRNNSAAGLFHLIDGDVEFQVYVRTRKASDNTSYPDRDYQFGGIILRNPLSNAVFGRENYIFNVIGYRGYKLQVETKSTENGFSKVVAKDWPSGDAELKVVRNGFHIKMYARELHSTNWILINSLERKDLPDTLEIGLIVYSTGVGERGTDIAINFKDLKIDSN
jgi:hypothetical protein